MHQRIREIRMQHGLSMAAFGREIGISSASVSNIENNKNGVSNQTIVSICNKFRVREEWLRDGIGPMYEENSINAHLYEWAVRTLSDGDPFKIKLFEAMSRLSPEQWEAVKKFARSLIEDEEQ